MPIPTGRCSSNVVFGDYTLTLWEVLAGIVSKNPTASNVCERFVLIWGVEVANGIVSTCGALVAIYAYIRSTAFVLEMEPCSTHQFSFYRSTATFICYVRSVAGYVRQPRSRNPDLGHQHLPVFGRSHSSSTTNNNISPLTNIEFCQQTHNSNTNNPPKCNPPASSV
ncbi:hypothetical protein BDZ91DRAFT_432600 [Kalaharituber pfeilii]|nr:hypothetical protein BDZ91DRAFT_432600 [Kalaharituber pfeilii]